MNFKDEITKNRADARDNIWKDMTDDEVDKIIDHVGNIEDRLTEIECKIFSGSVQVPVQVRTAPTPPEPSDRYCELFEKLMDAIRDQNRTLNNDENLVDSRPTGA